MISCAIPTKEEVDEILVRATSAGGSAPAAATYDGSYIGYAHDPDGHIWELVYNDRTAAAQLSQAGQ